MKRIVILCQGALFVFLVGLGLTRISSSETVSPLKVDFVFSAKSGVIPLSVPISAPNMGVGFRLSLEPDFDIHHNVVVLVLSLRHLNDSTDASNLLDPTGRSHGYETYIFAASDFVHGARQSLDGEKRTVILTKLGLELRIDVYKALVDVIPERSAAEPRYRFNQLSVGVDVRGGAPADPSIHPPKNAGHSRRDATMSAPDVVVELYAGGAFLTSVSMRTDIGLISVG